MSTISESKNITIQQILYSPKLMQFSDYELNTTQTTISSSERVEDIVGKGDYAG